MKADVIGGADRSARQQVHHRQRGHGFATAGLADQAMGFAARQRQGDAPHRFGLAAERHPQIGQAENRVCHRTCHRRRSAPNRSRSPSPSRLMPSTSANSAIPGVTITHGLKNMYSLASAIISPQLGKGGGTPSPRNDSDASSRIASAISRVATTTK